MKYTRYSDEDIKRIKAIIGAIDDPNRVRSQIDRAIVRLCKRELSYRQTQCLKRYYAENGGTYKKVADELGLDVSTVARHAKSGERAIFGVLELFR